MGAKTRLLIGAFCLGILLCTVGIVVLMLPPRTTTSLTLEIAAQKTDLSVNETVNVNARITNTGTKTVRLVLPGDGSEHGWRTPITVWKITRLPESETEPPETYDPFSQPRCGNVNALKMDEIFNLAPNQTKDIGQQTYLPPFQKAGRYLVTYSYKNRPQHEWRGMTMGIHDPVAMLLIKHSTECSLKSNQVLFTVTN